MDIKLLALDMDGTTYYKGGEIVPANIKPIKEALDKGVEVVIVTGRPALAKQNKLIENGFDSKGALIAACNGACIYDFNNKKLIESNPIDSETARKIFELTLRPEFKQVEVWGYVDDLNTSIISRNENHTDGFEFESNFFDGEYKVYDEVKENFNYKFFKLLGFNINADFVKEAQKLGLETAVSGDDWAVEINAKGINKAFAVKWLAEHLNITKDQIMTIGDGMNDLPMIEYAGYGVSLKNSVQDVKDAARIHIDKTNEEAGVAEAINKYILNK